MDSLEKIVGTLLTRQQEAIERQNLLMEQLMSATQSISAAASNNSSTPTPSTTSSAPETLMDVVAKNIREFDYDPEEGQIFGTWYERHEDVFRIEAEQLDDAAKVRLMLRKVSTTVFNKYKDYILPKQPRDVTFQQTVEILKKLFGRKESLFSTRVKCMQMVRGESEDVISYAAKVNRLCEQFLLNNCTTDNFKCLMFVNGLKCQKFQEYKSRLLTLLDSETNTNPLTLDHLVAEIERINTLKRDTATNEHREMQVNAVSDVKNKNDQNLKPRRPCWQCGNMHFVRDCSYTNHKCIQCGKVGHKEGFCSCFSDNSGKQKQQQQHHRQKQTKGNFKKTRKEIKSVYTTKSTHKNRRFISLQINKVGITLQHDTGSDVTIISKTNWMKIGKPSLQCSTHTPRDASTNKINIIGEFISAVVVNGDTQTCNILVSSLPTLNLFGSDLMEQFNLWNKPIDSYTSCNTVQVNSITESDIYKMFPQVFRNEIGHCTHFKVHLQLKPQAVPVFRPKRQVAYAAKEHLDTELCKLEREGILSPVTFSEWAAPIVVVRKASGGLRICGDYSTGLNTQLEPHTYPLPIPDEIFVNFNKCSFFSIIDLNNAYMQIEVDDDTKKLLVINTHRGMYTFNRLAQGVRSAPGAFQQCMEKMVAGINGVFPYLDDVVVATPTREENVNAVIQVFKRLHQYNITVNFEKCKFFKTSCTYLGHHVDGKGIYPDQNKVKTILEFSPPKNITELRSFLGAVNYYGKFLPEMRKLRNPMDNLLKKDVKWNWSSSCQRSFERFKDLLSSDLLLTHYDPKLPIKVAADASNVGLGAYICHIFPNGNEKAIYHASRSLTPAEKNYSQIEKEGLALVFAVVKFHKYLFGRQFTLQTDHKPLLAIFGNKKGIPAHSANRLQRWALILMSYDFNMEYVSTHQFGAADVLSRLINNVPKPEEDTIIASIHVEDDIKMVIDDITSALPLTFKMICAATNKDSNLQNLILYLQSGKWPNNKSSEMQCYFSRKDNMSIVDDCVMFGERIVIPTCFRKRVLRELHKGHHGIERTKALARSFVYWPHLDDEIKQYVQNCLKCSLTAKTLPKTTLCSWPLSTRPMERIHIDIAGPVDNFYYFLIIDSFSKWPQIYQIKSISSNCIINCLNDFTSLFGNPELIISDNGTQFSSQRFLNFCQENGITHKFTSPYHPQSNGQAERFVDTLKRALKKLKGSGTSYENLQTFLKCYRSTPNPNTTDGKSPSELFVGRRLRTNLDLMKKPEKSQMQQNVKMQEQFNKRHGAKERKYQIGQKVFAKIFKLNKSEWFPATIRKILGNVNYEVEIENIPDFRAVRSHANQLRPRYTEHEISPNFSLFDYFDLQPARVVSTESITDKSTEVVCVPQTNPSTQSKNDNELQDQFSSQLSNLSHPDSQSSTHIQNTTPAVIETSPHTPVTTPQIQVDKPSTTEVRRSTRRKRPPAWTPDYYLPTKRRDVGIPK